MSEGKKTLKKKTKTAIDKLLLGVVIGGAIGSVVGATISKKENREIIRSKLKNSSGALKKILNTEATKSKKNSIWHYLNTFFFKKK